MELKLACRSNARRSKIDFWAVSQIFEYFVGTPIGDIGSYVQSVK